MSDRFCYVTDAQIGVPGYYRMMDDGQTIDLSLRYEWHDLNPDDPTLGDGEFRPAEKQYALLATPGVALETQIKMSQEVAVAPASEQKTGILGRKKKT